MLKYDYDTTYHECALDTRGNPWCPTKVTTKGRFDFYSDEESVRCPVKSWGYCGRDCPIADPPGGDQKDI